MRMRGTNLNLCILPMLEEPFSLGAAHVSFHGEIKKQQQQQQQNNIFIQIPNLLI